MSTCDQETLLLRAVSEVGKFCIMISAILCLLPPRYPSFTNYDIWDGEAQGKAVVLTPGCASPGMLFINESLGPTQTYCYAISPRSSLGWLLGIRQRMSYCRHLSRRNSFG